MCHSILFYFSLRFLPFKKRLKVHCVPRSLSEVNVPDSFICSCYIRTCLTNTCCLKSLSMPAAIKCARQGKTWNWFQNRRWACRQIRRDRNKAGFHKCHTRQALLRERRIINEEERMSKISLWENKLHVKHKKYQHCFQINRTELFHIKHNTSSSTNNKNKYLDHGIVFNVLQRL